MTNKKKNIMYLVLLLCLLAGFMGVNIYCQNQSAVLRSYEFDYQEMKTNGDAQAVAVAEKDGLWLEFIIPENKVWDDKTRQDDLFTGAQYDIYLHNSSERDFQKWQGTIEMSGRLRIDSFWNMDCKHEDNNVISFLAKDDNATIIKAGKEGKIGAIIYSQHLLYPKKISIKGYFTYEPMKLPVFWVLTVLGLMWVIAVCTEFVVRIKTIHYEAELADKANQAKSDFLSRMSHEIRTPMNAVVGMTEIMLRDNLTAQQREYMEVIHHSGLALLDIINDILDFSKIEAGKIELVEDIYSPKILFHDLQMILQNRAEQKHLELILDYDKNIPEWLLGDELRIRQCLINLANNSIKFTDKGSVCIIVKVESNDGKNVALRMEIQDTGMGIKPEDMERLFGAFEQLDTKKNRTKEGTGLGLSITKNLVELLGGKIQVESTYGQGSTFHFTINQQIADEPEKSRRNLKSFVAPKARALIVDDNEINLKVAVGLMEPLEMKLTTATSGPEALDLIKQNIFDIIFMDHMMPIMDGTETTKYIRQMPEPMCSLPVVALTASVTQQSKQKLIDAGMSDYVSKPIDMDIMKDTLRKWLPEELIEEAKQEKAKAEVSEDVANEEIKGIDVKTGIKNCGSRDAFMKLLVDYYKIIPMKLTAIRQYMAEEIWQDYQIEVHGLKSTSRTVGAVELAKEFEHLETLAKKDDIPSIMSETEGVLQHYEEYREYLKPLAEQDFSALEPLEKDVMKKCFANILAAAESFDIDRVDGEIAELAKYHWPDNYKSQLEAIEAYAADVDLENVKTVIEAILSEEET